MRCVDRFVLIGCTSAPRLGAPLPHLHQDWAHPCHICIGTGRTPATSAPGLAHACHISTGTGRTPARYAPGPARGGWTGCADRSWSTTRANTTMPTMTFSTLRCECHSLAHSDTHTNAEARMRHVPSVCVRACVRACVFVCAWPKARACVDIGAALARHACHSGSRLFGCC